MADLKYADYNGQSVVVDDFMKKSLNDSVANINATTGYQGRKDWTAKEFDYALNPTTAGARWGEASTTSAPATAAPAASGGLLNPAPVQTIKASTYKPTQQTVNANSLVQNQIAGITSQDSALNQLAKTEAQKAASSRGLLNSSLAVGAGQKAVLQSALPIAQQDASTYGAADSANAQYANSASQFNANAENAASTANAANALQDRLAAIQANTTLTVTEKNNQSQQAIAAAGNKSAETIAAGNNQTQQNISTGNNQAALNLADKNNQSQQAIAAADAANKIILQNIDADTRVKLANLDNTSKTNLQNLVSANQQLLQTNVNASNIFTQYMTNLANISTNDKMDGPAKQQAADNQLNALKEQLSLMGGISGLDLSKYFTKADSYNTPATTTPTQDFTDRS